MPGRYVWRKGKRVHVHGHLRKDTGKPGRTPKSQRFGADIREGALRGWGKDVPMPRRHQILRGLVRRDGYGTVIRRLSFLINVSTDSATRRVARADRRYLQNHYR